MTTSNIKVEIPCDIHKVWETVLAVERYNTWQSGVDKTVVTDEKQFTVYMKNGYSTVFTVTAARPCSCWELDVENSHVKGHWTIRFASRGSITETDFTASAEAKGLSTRPAGKSVFEKTYLKKEQSRFAADLKKALDSFQAAEHGDENHAAAEAVKNLQCREKEFKIQV